MSFFSQDFLKQFTQDSGGGSFLGIISGGPSAWAGSSDMWSGLGSRIGFEVNVNGVLGHPGAGSLAERAQAAEQSEDVMVMGPSQQGAEGEGEGVQVYDLNRGVIVDIWDSGDSFGLLEIPVPTLPQEQWLPPEPTPDWPPLRWASLDGLDWA